MCTIFIKLKLIIDEIQFIRPGSIEEKIKKRVQESRRSNPFVAVAATPYVAATGIDKMDWENILKRYLRMQEHRQVNDAHRL